MKKTAYLTVAYLIFAFLGVYAQTQTTQITTTEVTPSVYRLFVNNAVAVVAFTGPEGTVLIDAAYEHTAKDLLKELENISNQPVKYLINTHIHGDHTGGNLVLGKDVDIIAHKNVKSFLGKEQRRGERIIPAFPDYALPNITFSGKMELTINGQEIQLKHLEGGHTNSDIIVYFPDSKVLVVGDLLFAGFFPFVDTNNGGNPFKFLENILYIIDNYPPDTKVIGGHGPVFSMEQFKNYRTALTQTIDVIATHKKNGLTKQEMVEQRILKEWESFGSFFITEERWIETIYPFL
ncbi:MAG: MBL fold metallo-hydrolase [Candidatus Moranbacteria bacterium]|nr:MBL fold metallo-hydrolase [Candidatus Moranbacteria bacterium]